MQVEFDFVDRDIIFSHKYEKSEQITATDSEEIFCEGDNISKMEKTNLDDLG